MIRHTFLERSKDAPLLDSLLLASTLIVEASSIVGAKLIAGSEPFSGLTGYIFSYFYFVSTCSILCIIPGFIVVAGVRRINHFFAVHVFRAVRLLSLFGLLPFACWSLLIALSEAAPVSVEFYRYRKPDWISSWVLHYLASPQGLVILACLWLPLYYLASGVTNKLKNRDRE